MLDPSIMEAQSLLWKQVEDWARAHPKEKVHDGMVLILQRDSPKYAKIVSAQVGIGSRGHSWVGRYCVARVRGE